MRFERPEILIEFSAMKTFSSVQGGSSVLASPSWNSNGEDGKMSDTVRPAQKPSQYRSFSPSRAASYGFSIVRAVHFCTALRKS
jgi:hypothetical protein